MREEIIQRGAEAVLIKKGDLVLRTLSNFTKFSERSLKRQNLAVLPSANFANRFIQTSLLKRRVVKGYRLKELDEKLRKLRTRSEARLLEKAAKLISVPRVVKVDDKTKEIDMEFISGLKLSDNLDAMKNWKEVCLEIGENIAKLHDVDIIHGDLTTSNMIWSDANSLQLSIAAEINVTRSARPVNKKSEKIFSEHGRAFGDRTGKGKLYFIDFGLGFHSNRIEDKAVDLHLIKQALEAKHFLHFKKFFDAVLEGYKISKNYKEVMKRFEKVEKRGRYKKQY